MDVFNQFATDEKLEVEGTWKQLSKTARVLVARAGNPNWVADMRKQLELHRIELDAGGDEADAIAKDIEIGVESRTVLLGWQGLTYRGKPAPYSAEMAKTMMGVREFRKRVLAIANDFENYRLKEEAATGNVSASTSDSVSDGAPT